MSYDCHIATACGKLCREFGNLINVIVNHAVVFLVQDFNDLIPMFVFNTANFRE